MQQCAYLGQTITMPVNFPELAISQHSIDDVVVQALLAHQRCWCTSDIAVQACAVPCTIRPMSTITPTDYPPIPVENLPLWMRQAQRRVDWGVLLVLGFAIAASWSFLMQTGLPESNANRNYAFMTADFAEALREGVLYPRWSPHVLAGYGAPIPNFYPPGAPYSAAVVEVLLTNDTWTALRLMYALAIWGAAIGMYSFVTRWLGSRAGVLASLLYVFSPYIAVNVPLVMGDLPGAISLALLPTLLWAVSRLIILNHTIDFALVALTGTALLLTEPRSALVGLILTFTLVAWAMFDGSVAAIKRGRWKLLVTTLLAVCIAVTSAACYWLPALIESYAVRWVNTVSPVNPLHLTIAELVAPLRQLDPAEIIRTPQFTLGRVLVIYVLLGIGGAAFMARRWRRDWGQTLPLLFVMIGGLLTLLLVTPTLWAGQPWLLGTLTLCCAVAGAATLALIERFIHRLDRVNPLRWRTVQIRAIQVGDVQDTSQQKARPISYASRPGSRSRRSRATRLVRVLNRLAFPLACAFALIGALPVWLLPMLPETTSAVTPLAQVQYTLEGFGVPVLPSGLPLPTTIPDNSEDNRFLINSYRAESISRFSPDLTPGDMAIGFPETAVFETSFPLSPVQNSHGGRFAILSQRESDLTMLLSWFPGWRATLNGRPIPLRQEPATGLVQMHIPPTPNWSELVLYFGATTIRQAGWWLMSCGLVSILWITRLRGLRRRRQDEPFFDDLALLNLPDARLLTVVMFSFVGVLALTTLPGAPVALGPGAFHALEGTVTLRAQTDSGLEALAYRLEQDLVPREGTLKFTVYWRAPRTLLNNTRVRAHLYDVNRRLRVLDLPLRHPGDYPTRLWRAGGFVADTYVIELPPTLFPGSYQVIFEAFICADDASAECDRRVVQRFLDFNNTSQTSVNMVLPKIITILD